MTQYLPPNLLALFAPRDPIPYLPPVTKLSHEKKTHGYFGVGQYLHLFEDPKDTPPPIKIETREERLERKQREKLERAAYIREQGIALWDPHNNDNATSDPYKTLFVARVNPDTTESKLRKEFEAYGPVRKAMMIHDKISGKPRGYAFIEFENEKDMHSAYKHADGKKIEGRRVLVDVERGRTVKGWLPRRLGGGLGDTRTRPNFRDDRDENRSYRDRSFDRRDRDRDRSFRRSRSRDKDRRRRSREKERDRGDRRSDYRDKNHRDSHRERHRDRYGFDSKLRGRDESSRKEGYESYSEQKMSSHSYDDSSSGYSRRHRSRSRERSDRKRHGRSRSRSQDRSERKRSKFNESNNSTMEKQDNRHNLQYSYADGDNGEIEEGEDRSYDAGFGKNDNDNDYNQYQDSYSQPAYVAYNIKED